MRPEKLYLTDIYEAAQAIAAFCESVGYEQFEGSDLLHSAVLQKLIVVGEAASHMPDGYCRQHPEIPWVDMIAFRNFAVHEYFAVNWQIVWDTAMVDIPMIREQIEELLKQFE